MKTMRSDIDASIRTNSTRIKGIDQLYAELIEIMHIAGGNAFGCRLIVSEMTFVSIRII